MQIEIERMDHLGNGIGYLNGKVAFVPKTIPGDIVNIRIIKETKAYINADVVKYLKRGKDYVKEFCPYYLKCGGCHLQNFTYEKTLEYKKERVQNILNKVKINQDIEVIPNEVKQNYRNKIELKIQNGKIGYYIKKTHELVEIDKCLVAKKCLNNFLAEIKKMQIKNGDITLRCNYNDELLIAIYTQDKIALHEEDYPNYKVVGIILNDKCFYGENKFLDIINNTFFEVSYNSFFQVNSYINSKLFEILNKYIDGDTIIDLYSGVGTLAIMASKNAKKVYAIENIPNAVINGMRNAKINSISNINFILGKVEDKIMLIDDKIDAIIVDPPRKGLDENTIKKILELSPIKIIYISCETQKLSEDLKYLLNNYTLKKGYILDMFSYSYHCESITVLERR